jgi:hypothetical protein
MGTPCHAAVAAADRRLFVGGCSIGFGVSQSENEGLAAGEVGRQ